MRKLLWILGIIFVLATAGIGLLYLAPEKVAAISFDITRGIAGLEKKTLTLPGGETYVYLEGGRGEPTLLLHGFGANKDNFTLVARYLKNSCHIIAPDHIGFGPEEVKSMWLLDPGGVWSAPESDLHKKLKEGVNPLIAKNADEFARIYHFTMSKPPPIPRPILDVMARERIDNIELEKKIFQEIKADSVEKRIAGLKIPALIVWGDEDRAISVETAPILHKLLPDSQVIIMKGIGHLPMVEAPGATARDYLKFREGL